MEAYIEDASTLAHEKNYDLCAQLLVDQLTNNRPRVLPGQGLSYLNRLIPRMLAKNRYADVAHILWGNTLFNAEPESVRLIWTEIQKTSTMLVQGAGSCGKSYSFAAYFLLDWLEDPLWTCIKVVSLTAEHAKRNAFAHLKNLHRQSSIPLPGVPKERSIQANADDKQGIHLVAIPPGEDGSGRLQGFHPVPRKEPHSKFGNLSRVRALLDEAEEIPAGVWEDIDNMLITVELGTDHVKVAAAANPRDIDSKFGRRCEPIQGWDSLDIESSITWKSKLGWSVVRLDGARCENVVQKKLIYPGFLTYDGYRRYLLAGDTSAEYNTMARGFFPTKGLAVNVIPRDFLTNAVAQLNFTGPVTYCAAIDLAFEGEDKAPMTIGRFGMALGYNRDGVTTFFDRPKYCLQAESQFELIKNDPSNDPSKKMTQTFWLAHQIKTHCKTLNIQGVWLICDRTGNGTGVHDILRSPPPDGLGEDVVGIHYGQAATELKLFGESLEKASDAYDGIVTELFFALRNYLESDYLKISPSMDIASLTTELCTRRFKPGNKIRVEGKKEFKARGNPSPDKADSLSLLCHLVRMREGLEAVLLASTERKRDQEWEPGIVDQIQYMDWSHK